MTTGDSSTESNCFGAACDCRIAVPPRCPGTCTRARRAKKAGHLRALRLFEEVRQAAKRRVFWAISLLQRGHRPPGEQWALGSDAYEREQEYYTAQPHIYALMRAQTDAYVIRCRMRGHVHDELLRIYLCAPCVRTHPYGRCGTHGRCYDAPRWRTRRIDVLGGLQTSAPQAPRAVSTREAK